VPVDVQDGKLVHLPGRPVSAEERASRTPNRPWLRYSYLYRFWSDRVKVARYRVRLALGLPVEDGLRMTETERARADLLTFAVLSEIDREVREAGARLLLVSLPEQVQVQPDSKVLGLESEDYEIQDKLAAFAQRSGIAYLDVLPALREAYARNPQEPLYYPQDRHFRANGHALVAQRIREDLLERGWLAPSDAPRSVRTTP